MDGVIPCPLSARLAAVGFLVGSELNGANPLGPPWWLLGAEALSLPRVGLSHLAWLVTHLCFLRAVEQLISSDVGCPYLL